jgi:hypothetical protein
VSGAVHAPQSTTPPHPSAFLPHVRPIDAHVFGVHGGTDVPHLLATPPPPHVAGGVHEPQSIKPPQPSPCLPQSAPRSAHVFLVHGAVPHTLALPPPPQISPGTVHLPQSSNPPQPSATGPQFAPASAHVRFLQPESPPMSKPTLVSPESAVKPSPPNVPSPPPSTTRSPPPSVSPDEHPTPPTTAIEAIDAIAKRIHARMTMASPFELERGSTLRSSLDDFKRDSIEVRRHCSGRASSARDARDHSRRLETIAGVAADRSPVGAVTTLCAERRVFFRCFVSGPARDRSVRLVLVLRLARRTA